MDKNIDMKNKKNKENPLHLMKRSLGYILKNYKFSCIAVLVCILVSALTTLIATLFIQKLIDSYIIPLTQSAVHDYAPLAGALIKLSRSSYGRCIMFILLQQNYGKCWSGNFKEVEIRAVY